MDVERLARKLEPLMPEQVQRWLRARDTADPELKNLIDKQIVTTTYRVFGDVRKKILLSLPPENLAQRAIHLGTVMYDRERWPFGISRSEFLQGLAIFGRSGAGKTNVAFHVLEQLVAHGIPVLFLDWKRTGRHLLPLLRRRVNVYTPGRPLAPLAFNPFIPPPGREPGVYVNQVVDVLADAYTLGDGARSILQRALSACYAKGQGAFTIADVLSQVEAIPANHRARGWKVSAVRAMESLKFADLTSRDGLSQDQLAQKLLHENTIIELDALGSSEKKFLVPLLCSWLYSVRLASPVREKLTLAIVIEEAHHVLYRQERRSTETLMNMLLRQCREVGIGCVVVDQHPHLISSAALGNTFTSICLNLKDPADINRAAALSQVEDDEKWYFSQLPVGVGIVKLQDRWRSPVLVRFPLVNLRKGAVSNGVLAGYLRKRSTGATGLSAVGREFAQVSRGLVRDDVLETPELAFLQNVLEHPDDGVKRRYQRLGMSVGKANAMKLSLIARGWMEAQTVELGQTRKLLLRLTKPGREALGVEGQNGRPASLAHEYWKRFWARRFRERGYAVELEAPCQGGRVDVLAMRNVASVGIEIETGMSDAVSNVRRDLAAGFKRVVVVATDEKAFAKVGRELGAAGLLIKGRVEMVLRERVPEELPGRNG